MTKTTMSAIAGFKILNDIESDLCHRQEYHLRDAIARFNCEGSATPVPAGYKDLALVVRIDQADQVSQNQSVLVTEARAGQ